jgi:hypothetical protein
VPVVLKSGSLNLLEQQQVQGLLCLLPLIHNIHVVDKLKKKTKLMFLFVRESGGAGYLTAINIAVARCYSIANKLTTYYIKENEHSITGGTEASVPSSAKISCVESPQSLPQKQMKTLCLQLTAETQILSSVSGAVMGQARWLHNYTRVWEKEG